MSVADSRTRVHGPKWLIDSIAAERARLDIDRWDEVWDGELHMNPPPSFAHEDILGDIVAFLKPIVKEGRLGVLGNGGVRDPARGEKDYRTPDLCFVARGRESIIEGPWLNEGPDVAFEVRSPRDETYEKLDFYARRGVRELIVIEPATREVRLFRPAGEHMVEVAAGPDGALRCAGLGITLRTLSRPPASPVLELALASDASRRVEI